MGALSAAGLIGATIGLVVGWIDYRIVAAVVERKLRQLDRSGSPDEKADFERRIVWFHRLLLGATLAGFGVLGYWLGRLVGG